MRRLKEAYPHERPVLSSLPTQGMDGQADTDIRLHQNAAGRFGPTGDQFLSHDSAYKQKFKDILAGREQRDSVIADTIRQLEFDQGLHRMYLARGSDPQTGSEDWHRRWVAVYDDWLSVLRKIQHRRANAPQKDRRPRW